MASASITYICTMKATCTQTFTTYSDWSEHETQKHSKLQHVFYCNGLDGCTAAFRDERAFGRHYEEMHPAHPLLCPAEFLLDRRHGRFWCGFCGAVVVAPPYSEHPEFFRACHVESHLQGACGAGDWVYLVVQ